MCGDLNGTLHDLCISSGMRIVNRRHNEGCFTGYSYSQTRISCESLSRNVIIISWTGFIRNGINNNIE